MYTIEQSINFVHFVLEQATPDQLAFINMPEPIRDDLVKSFRMDNAYYSETSRAAEMIVPMRATMPQSILFDTSMSAILYNDVSVAAESINLPDSAEAFYTAAQSLINDKDRAAHPVMHFVRSLFPDTTAKRNTAHFRGLFDQTHYEISADADTSHPDDVHLPLYLNGNILFHKTTPHEAFVAWQKAYNLD